MNRPATKLATKGTLDKRAVSPKGASIPAIFEMFVAMVSKFRFIVPEYARTIRMKTKIPIVSALSEILLNRLPAK